MTFFKGVKITNKRQIDHSIRSRWQQNLCRGFREERSNPICRRNNTRGVVRSCRTFDQSHD